MNDKPGPSDARARREAELAARLRDNLKRRKQPASPQPEPASQGDGTRADEPLPPEPSRG